MRNCDQNWNTGDWRQWAADWKQWAGPWARRSRFFESGEIRLAILSLLEERARHGYELMKEFETRSGGSFKVSAGSMYPTLQQLEDEGLIAGEQQDGRKIYRLTELGRAELERERPRAERIWRRAEQWEDWSQMWNPQGFASLGGSLGHLVRNTVQLIKKSRGEGRVHERITQVLDRAAAEIANLASEFESSHRQRPL